MIIADIIRGAIPSANERLCDYILWEMTPYPMGRITAKSLYKAASRFKRASKNKISLCDLCDNKTTDHKWTCNRCYDALARCSKENEEQP